MIDRARQWIERLLAHARRDRLDAPITVPVSSST